MTIVNLKKPVLPLKNESGHLKSFVESLFVRFLALLWVPQLRGTLYFFFKTLKVAGVTL